MKKKPKAAHKTKHNSEASVRSSTRDSIKANVKMNANGPFRARRKLSHKNGGPNSNGSSDSETHPRLLENAVQRFTDLFDFAPIGYVSLSRAGRIVEINLTATQLFGLPRERLIGMPFAVYVYREDATLFLHHLLQCRISDSHVETELRLKDSKRQIIHALLSSAPAFSQARNGAEIYQTAIVDITQLKKAETALSELAQQQSALYEFARRRQKATSLNDIYNAALEVALAIMGADRAAILLYNEDDTMRFVASRGLSGKYRKAVKGHSPWKHDAKTRKPIWTPDVEVAKLPESLKAVIRTEGIRSIMFIPLVTEGKLIGKFVAYYNEQHNLTDEELRFASTVGQDLVDAIQHQRDEEALRESEAFMRATVEQATAGMSHCDTTGRITFANSTLCKMLGYKESQLVGKSFASFTHPDHVEESMHRFRKMMRDGKAYEFEKRYVCKNGSVIWAEVSASAVPGPDGKTQSAVSVVVDITARKQAERELQKAKERLEQRVRERTNELYMANKRLQSEIERRKGLEGEILSVSDREQQRLGQELHDGLCQHLTAVAFMTRSIALRLRHHRVVDAVDIEKVAELVNKAAVDTRNLSRALHRVDVDAAGLIVALQDLVDREIWRTPCQLEIKPSFRVDEDAAAAHLYRIAREAVINANKHAHARQIVVRVERVRKEMVLRVIDDGIGFPKELKPQQGLGFHIMKYRAQLMGGRLEIDSPQKGGTRVSCYLPVHSAHANNVPNRDIATGAVSKNSPGRGASVPGDLSLRHLAHQGAANA